MNETEYGVCTIKTIIWTTEERDGHELSYPGLT